MRCVQCGVPLEHVRSFCLHCGTLQEDNLHEPLECGNHAGQRAVGLCIVCGKPVCGDCAVTSEGRMLCDVVDHRTKATSWSSIHRSDFVFESDMIRQNLINAGIEAKIFSFRDHLETFWLQDTQFVRVMVPAHEREKALGLLQQLYLIDQPDTRRL